MVLDYDKKLHISGTRGYSRTITAFSVLHAGVPIATLRYQRGKKKRKKNRKARKKLRGATKGAAFIKGRCANYVLWLWIVSKEPVGRRASALAMNTYVLFIRVLAPGGRGCAKNPAKRFLVVALVVLKKRVLPESLFETEARRK